ncbi:MAG: SMC-Scp complex subunit ScpB [bacterium]
MNINKIAAVEALLFTAEEPVSVVEIADTLDVTLSESKEYINIIKKEFNQKKSHGIRLEKYDDSYMFVTKSHLAPYIKKLHSVSRKTRLSQAALETLSIIAYEQPITRNDIEEIRGVRADKTLSTLSKYNLIKELGRKDTTGNPIVYGTTEEFLRQFQLKALSDLPDIKNIDINKKYRKKYRSNN